MVLQFYEQLNLTYPLLPCISQYLMSLHKIGQENLSGMRFQITQEK